MPLIGRRTAVALVVLGVTVAVGALAGMLAARHSYEDDLAAAYGLEAAGARLLAAGLAEEAVLRQAGVGAAGARGIAAADFDSEARRALRLSREDKPSERLLAARVAAQRELRRARVRSGSAESRLLGLGQLTVATLAARRATRQLTSRQRQRRQDARTVVSRHTSAWLAVAGLAISIALLIALAGGPARRPQSE